MMRFGDSNRSLLKTVLGGLVAGMAFAAGAAAQQAPQLPPEEDARLALIDYCVLNESARTGQYDDYVGRCKCATKSLMSGMTEKDMKAVAKWRKPTSALKSRWTEAWNGCG